MDNTALFVYTHCRSPKGALALISDSGILWCLRYAAFYIYTALPCIF